MKSIQYAIAAICLASTPALWAQSADTIMVRGGIISLQPSVSSGALSVPNFGPHNPTRIDVGGKTQLGAGITYMATDNVALDIPLSTPFTHTITGDGAIAGVGKIGTVKALPVTLTAQYRFREPDAAVRPFIGAGLAYAHFFKQTMNGNFNGIAGGTYKEPVTVKTDSKIAPLLQLGVSVAIKDNWYAEASVAKSWLKTTSHLSSGQSISYRLDPFVYQLGVGYRF